MVGCPRPVAATAPRGLWRGVALPAPQPLAMAPHVPRRCRPPIALSGHQADRCTVKRCGLHTAVRCHHRTPPVALGAPLSKGPSLLNHITPQGRAARGRRAGGWGAAAAARGGKGALELLSARMPLAMPLLSPESVNNVEIPLVGLISEKIGEEFFNTR